MRGQAANEALKLAQCEGRAKALKTSSCEDASGLPLPPVQVWGVPSIEVTKVLWVAEQARSAHATCSWHVGSRALPGIAGQMLVPGECMG